MVVVECCLLFEFCWVDGCFFLRSCLDFVSLDEFVWNGRDGFDVVWVNGVGCVCYGG